MSDLLQQGIAAFQAGRHAEARRLLMAALREDPGNEQAWGWLYRAAQNDRERRECLQQILRLDPQNEKARQLLDELGEAAVPPFSAHEAGGQGTTAAPPPAAARPVYEIEADGQVLGDVGTIIMWQYIALVVGLLLGFVISLITANFVHSERYFMLGPTAMGLYVGISSVVNRVSIAQIRGSGQKYTTGKDAVFFGWILIIFSGGYILYVIFSLFLDALGLFRSSVPPIPAPDGFTTAFVVTEKVAEANRGSFLSQLVSMVMLVAGVIGCAWMAVGWLRKRPFPRFGGLFVMLILFSVVRLNTDPKNDAYTLRNCANLQALYDSGQYQIAEGFVHVRHEQPEGGHAAGDIIDVGTGEFEFSFYSASCGYTTTISHGGLLKENTYARIYYIDREDIVRIDLKNK